MCKLVFNPIIKGLRGILGLQRYRDLGTFVFQYDALDALVRREIQYVKVNGPWIHPIPRGWIIQGVSALFVYVVHPAFGDTN